MIHDMVFTLTFYGRVEKGQTGFYYKQQTTAMVSTGFYIYKIIAPNKHKLAS